MATIREDERLRCLCIVNRVLQTLWYDTGGDRTGRLTSTAYLKIEAAILGEDFTAVCTGETCTWTGYASACQRELDPEHPVCPQCSQPIEPIEDHAESSEEAPYAG